MASTALSFTLPPEWKDPERMKFLMAPIAPSSQQSSVDAKVKFWRSLVLSSCAETRKPVFSKQDLIERFRWNGTAPGCLGPVLEAMEHSGEVRKMSEWSLEGGGGGWVSWGIGMLGQPLSWAWNNYVSPKKEVTKSYTGEYILLAPVKELAEKVVKEHHRMVQYKSTDCVMTQSQFHSLCSRVVATETELIGLVEQQLAKDCSLAVSVLEGNKKVVKLAYEGSPASISETDLRILDLKEGIQKLSHQVKSLEQQVVKLKSEALVKYRLKQRHSALVCLRRAKAVEEQFIKREVALDNALAILTKIQLAETDAMILNAYKEGTSALKALRLSADEAAEVMDDLQEVLEDSNEVGNILAEDITPGGGVLEEELEQELDVLLLGAPTPTAKQPCPPPAPSSATTTTDDLERTLAALQLRDTTTKPEQIRAKTHVNTSKLEVQKPSSGYSAQEKKRTPLLS